MPIFENKRIILFLGCLAIFFPGAFVFGFPGVMAAQWQAMFQVNKADIGQLMFFILIGSGSSMYLAGNLQEKFGSRTIIFTGSLVCSLAIFFVGHATSMAHVYVWAFVEGFFCGFVYIPCLTLFQRLFPENRGLITGVVNLTFGGAAAVMSPVFTFFLVSKGYLSASNIAAAIALCVGTVAALFVRLPKSMGEKRKNLVATLSLKQTLHLAPFWYLWCVWALAGASGISLIVLASSFGQHLGYGITQYVVILTSFNILNGLGRLACGRLADRYSKPHIMTGIFLMAAFAYACMPFAHNLYMVSFLAGFVGLAFGGLFTVSAPLVTDVFGLENFGRIFGLVFTAYGFLAGFLGPWLSGIILDATNSNYRIVFWLFTLFYLISSIFILKVRPFVLTPENLKCCIKTKITN
ncbi:MAG: MFS transporter [Pseudomonadota bacterium]